jgi:preprotein translocase subunit SecB
MSEPQQAQPTFQIVKIYVKDVSLEIPNAPHVFTPQQAQPQLEVRLDTAAAPFTEGYFEASVSATVTAKIGDKTLFLAEAVQAGIFEVRNIPAEELRPLLATACPTILFPYLRETISDLVVRGGFPPVLLAPVSFEALYMQRLQQEQQSAGAPANPDAPKAELAR